MRTLALVLVMLGLAGCAYDLPEHPAAAMEPGGGVVATAVSPGVASTAEDPEPERISTLSAMPVDRITTLAAEADEPAEIASCVLDLTFWRDNPDAWPTTELSIANHPYQSDELLRMLRGHSGGDASVRLARQLVAAYLNVASGAAVPEAAGDAELWIAREAPDDGARLPYHTRPGSDAAAQAEAIAERLAAYNHGYAGVDGCDEPADG